MNQYNVILYKSETDKLAHVMISLDTLPVKIPSSVKSSALYWKNNLGKVKTNQHTSSFFYMILNTDVDNWTHSIEYKMLDKHDAQEAKREIMEELKEAGFVTSIKMNTAAGHRGEGKMIPVVYRGVFEAEKTTLNHFKKFCEKCVVGLNIRQNEFNDILRKMYSEMNYFGEVSKFKIWEAYSGVANEKNTIKV